jgi:hypothetical protein
MKNSTIINGKNGNGAEGREYTYFKLVLSLHLTRE